MVDTEAMCHQVKILEWRGMLRYSFSQSFNNSLNSYTWLSICLEQHCTPVAPQYFRQVVEAFEMSDLVRDTILRGSYVDLLKLEKNKEDAHGVLTPTKQVLKQCGFTLTKSLIAISWPWFEKAKEVIDITLYMYPGIGPEMGCEARHILYVFHHDNDHGMGLWQGGSWSVILQASMIPSLALDW